MGLGTEEHEALVVRIYYRRAWEVFGLAVAGVGFIQVRNGASAIWYVFHIRHRN